MYEDSLYNVLHHLKDEKIEKEIFTVNQKTALRFLRDAFEVSNEKHEISLEKVKTREPPTFLIDVSILLDPTEISSPKKNRKMPVAPCRISMTLVLLKNIATF